ncbi:MAG: O-antigen ligase family protein [Flavobacterium sp.]
MNKFFKKKLFGLKDNITYVLLCALLVTILLNSLINSFLLLVALLVSLIYFEQKKIRFNNSTIFLILLFLIMLLSNIWSINQQETTKAIIKELPLIIIPLVISFNNEITEIKRNKIIKYFSYSIVFFSVYFIVRASLKYFSSDSNVFFGHELVTKELNAVHYSVFVSFSLFYFITQEVKTIKIIIIQLFLISFLFLLQSKIIIITSVFLISLYFFFYSKSANKMRLRNIVLLGVVFFSFLFFNKIKEKIEFEFQLNRENNIGHTVIPKEIVGDRIISMKEAWEKDKFEQSDFFSGASFRVYQFRMFLEIMKEENVFFQGLGLNASYKKLEEKGIKYNVFQGNEITEGYQKKNFHNQYIQNFAELGLVGFILLILILFVNLKNAINNKDFIHIAFAILMISLFLTESFLWRQRGVVFFTAFYCLFNTINLSKKEIK